MASHAVSFCLNISTANFRLFSGEEAVQAGRFSSLGRSAVYSVAECMYCYCSEGRGSCYLVLERISQSVLRSCMNIFPLGGTP